MKAQLRSDFAKKISLLSAEDKKKNSHHIQGLLKSLLFKEQGLWAGYQHLSDEPAINWAEVSPQIQWAFPKLQNEKIEFFKEVTDFDKSTLGFKEPSNGEPVAVQALDGVIMPGLAFDKKGHRLGRGKAYYDRALQTYSGKKIGICFNVSFCEELPEENHDVKCDWVVTDQNVYSVKKNKEL